MTDQVQKPAHYHAGPVETIEVIEGLVADPLSYLYGNVLKYAMRMQHKNDPVTDAKKCRQYLNRLIRRLDGKPAGWSDDTANS